MLSRRLMSVRYFLVFLCSWFEGFTYSFMTPLAVLYMRVNKFFTEKLALALDEC